MTYDPIDTNETDTDADGNLTIDDLTATTVAGLDTSSGTGNEQIFTDGEGGLIAGGYSGIPVAFQNLIAWYPFDSATYGGNNADDVTGGEAYYGDSTAYDGTVNGATYESSGGGTDINAGANSGYYDFDGLDDNIVFGTIPTVENKSELTLMCWVKHFNKAEFELLFGTNPNFDDTMGLFDSQNGLLQCRVETETIRARAVGNDLPNGTWQHIAMTYTSSTLQVYQDAVKTASASGPSSTPSSNQIFKAGGPSAPAEENFPECELDDCRVYDVALSQSQIQTIVNNTPH
jgi:hypothetical protein